MKINKTNLSVLISSLALVVVLIIQVNWILETAKIKEELFSEKANMVLSRTMNDLRTDEETCQKIDACVEMDSTNGATTKLGKSETHTIDSLFNSYMKLYNLTINYTYQVSKPTPIIQGGNGGFANYIYNQPSQNSTRNNGFELKLIFPAKRQYIMAEMGPLFITSVLLIMAVMVIFWLTVRSLIKEKKISEHTTDFLNNMTHEFKTPLTNISLAGKMIVKDATNTQQEKTKHYSSIILEENNKLQLQVEQMLSITALERGEIPLQKTELNINELLYECCKAAQMQMEHLQGEIKLELNAKQPILHGDKAQLKNAFNNLIDNAIKYSIPPPIITIQTFNHGNNICIVIADQGIGIKKEYQKKVFSKYFRVPTGDVHNVKGFGLGLAYVKKLIELHKGTIELQSEIKKGSTFKITLPYV